jgi:hypothetical protein
MGTEPNPLVEIEVGDDPTTWTSLGFTVGDDGVARVGQVGVRLAGARDDRGRGILGWTLAAPAAADDVDGLPTGYAVASDDQPATAAAPVVHPNGALAIDHIVVMTPDLDRTTEALGAVGLEARRTREAGGGRLQRFFRLGEVILELVGPAVPAGDGPATFWGLAITVDDIDATATHLVGRIGEPKAAVQAGRRIATLRVGDELSVPIAMMSAPTAPRSFGAGGGTGSRGSANGGTGSDR